MVPGKGRVTSTLLGALLVFLPSAAQAQMRNCPHMNGPTQGGQMQGPSMNSTGSQMFQMSFMSQMSRMGGQMGQMCGMRTQISRLTTTQPQQLQFTMQQIQMAMLQQTQVMMMQQQLFALRQMQLTAMGQSQLGFTTTGQPPPGFTQQPQPAYTPPSFNTAQQPQLGRTGRKEIAALLAEIAALQKRLDGLLEAAERHELQPSEASAAQHDVNVLQDKVDALAKPPDVVLDHMSALKRQSDDLLQAVAARPAAVLAALRSSR